jgi:hypothetical protein
MHSRQAAKVGTEQGDDRGAGESTFEWEGTAFESEEAAISRQAECRLRESGLTHPCLPGQQDHAALPVGHALQRGVETSKLNCPADEPARRCGRERPQPRPRH